MLVSDLAETLAKIPHLKIGQISGDSLRLILEEVDREVDGYSSVELNSQMAGKYVGEFQDAWSARGIIDYDPDSKRILTYQRSMQIQAEQGKQLKHFTTDLYERLVEVRKLIESITQKPKTTRIFKLKAKTQLPWHSHLQSIAKEKDYKRIVVQIPLINSEACIYQVRHREIDQIIEQIYSPGEIWIFNSFHQHRVINQSQCDRLSLFIETDLHDFCLSEDLNSLCQKYLKSGGVYFREEASSGNELFR